MGVLRRKKKSLLTNPVNSTQTIKREIYSLVLAKTESDILLTESVSGCPHLRTYGNIYFSRSILLKQLKTKI